MPELRIKEIIKEKGITQKELADRMGKAPQYINNVVNGGKDTSVNILEAIADALDVPLASLFEDYKPKDGIILCPHCGREIVFGKERKDIE